MPGGFRLICHGDEVSPVGGLTHTPAEIAKLIGADKASSARDLLYIGDVVALSGLHRFNILGRLEQTLRGPRVQPGHPTAHQLHRQLPRL